MSKIVNISEAKTARNGKSQARITPLVPAKGKVTYGLLEGKFVVPDDFDAPSPDIETLFIGDSN